MRKFHLTPGLQAKVSFAQSKVYW